VSLPKPYYEHAGITIYHADCRDILPHLPKVDLVLTDPPYGIGRDGKPKSTSSHGGHKGYEFLGWDNAPPTSEEVGSIIASGKDAVIWGANYFPAALPPSPGWLLWDKGQRLDQADGELAFTTRCAPLRVCTINRVAIATDGAEHPTQKPIKLMSWCLSFFPKAETILDPFMGSGTTLVAAKLLGRKAIGIEREEKYCEIAVQRLGQDSLFMEESA
jgi:DNA modification methylase